MLQKWKIILANWINCYSDGDKKELSLNLGSILDIISHLRANFNLDESKSSLLDAHTIHDFVLEKYPGFKFENGTAEPSNEEEICVAASLLLLFVCVNSKDVNIKNVMCKNLSLADQETILKFSKNLMGCSHISSTDVLQAIAEACGQDIAGAITTNSASVLETPPALRSLHGEVRRLQAALDAERFDRNYLQEELTRTNMKLEKLVKDKEQYKVEIVNLKAKISLCCGEENKTVSQDISNNNSAKLLKQLEQTEHQLENVQEELSDVQYERDAFKTKLEGIKLERDKYYALSQQENTRASQLAEELESERRQNNSLKELVTELRQHNQLNGFDTSQLECDDLDGTFHSFQHNSSVCSEICVNVVEVQLSEERAKIVVLKQHIQSLQDQLQALNQKYENEWKNFHEELSERDTNILNLKHRINEEIEKKNIMKLQFEGSIEKLNNELNELEQLLKDTTENSRKAIEIKAQEIQGLQEEKLSLLQSFSNNTVKLENINKELKIQIDNEKSSKIKLREDYDNHIMKLNEKVLNRNNELVELQNKMVKDGEQREQLQLELRIERERSQDLAHKYNADTSELNGQIKEIENSLQKKCSDITVLQNQVQDFRMYINNLNQEKESLMCSITKLEHDYKTLEENNISLLDEKRNQQNNILIIKTNMENMTSHYDEEKKNILCQLDETNATVDTLKNQLQTEIEFKMDIQNKHCQVVMEHELLLNENNKLKVELSKAVENTAEKNATINSTNESLTVEKEKNEKLEVQCKVLEDNKQQLSKEILEKSSSLHTMKNNLDEQMQTLTEKLREKSELAKSNELELKKEIEKVSNRDEQVKLLKLQCNDYQLQVDQLLKEVQEKSGLIYSAKENINEQKQRFDLELHEKCEVIKSIEHKMKKEADKLHEEKELNKVLKLQSGDLKCQVYQLSGKNTEKNNLLHSERDNFRKQKQIFEEELQKRDVIENLIKCELTKETEKTKKEMEISENLKLKCEELKCKVNHLSEKLVQVTKLLDLSEERLKNIQVTCEDEIHEKNKTLETMICELKKEKDIANSFCKEIEDKNNIMIEERNKITALEEKAEQLSKLLEEREIAITNLRRDLLENEHKYSMLQTDFDSETTKLMTRLNEMEKLLKDFRIKTNNALDKKELEIQTLHKLNGELQNGLDIVNDKSLLIKREKEVLAEQLHKEIYVKNKFEKEYLNKCALLNNITFKLNEEITKKNKEIIDLKKENESLTRATQDQNNEITTLKTNICKEDAKIKELLNEVSKSELLVSKLEEEMRIQINDKLQTIEALEKENIQLHYTIEEDNSNHEILINEKDSIIETVEEQLKLRTIKLALLQKEYENDKLMWEKCKVHMQEQLTVKENYIKELTEKICQINHSLLDTDKIMKGLEKQLTIVNDNNIAQTLRIELLNKCLTDSEAIIESLNSEKSVRDSLETEKESWIKEKEQLLKRSAQNQSVNEMLITERNTLLNEKAILIQELTEEKSLRKITDQSRETLLAENKKNEQDLIILKEKINRLLEERECLTQQLVEEKLTKDLLEKEKEYINCLKVEFEEKVLKEISEKVNVEEQNKVIIENNEYLLNEIKRINAEKADLEAQKLKVYHENKQMQNKLEALNIDLINSNNKLIAEKESLVESLAELKSSFANMEFENSNLSSKVGELSQKFESEINSRQEEINIITQEFSQLKSDYKNLEETKNEIVVKLNSGLENIIEYLRKSDFKKELVQNVLTNTDKNIGINEKLETVFNVILELSTYITAQKYQTREQENRAVNNFSLIVKENELEIDQLRKEINELENNKQAAKTENLNQIEEYKNVLQVKLTDIQKLEQENKSLQDDLNDIKVQLDTKVHSLRDKLIDNEHLTEKLKKTYECQIENLNVMISKLTTYLKDKTMEFDLVRNENDRLQALVEENNKAMYLLEEEVKSQKHNQDKIINDFESERLVLKNMITVTESVMEDQKVNLNKKIADHWKFIQVLQEENKALKENTETEKQNALIQINDKSTAFDTVFKELTSIREEKGMIEENARKLQEDLQVTTSHLQTLTCEKKYLEQMLLDCKQEVTEAVEKNKELHLKEEELTNEINIIQKDLVQQRESREELERIIEIKTVQNDDVVTKLNELSNKINELEEKNYLLVMENTKLLNHLDEKKNIETNLSKEINKLKDLQGDYVQSMTVISEKQLEIDDLHKNSQHEKEQNQQLQDVNDVEKLVLTDKCSLLQEYQTKAEEELLVRQKDIVDLQDEIKALNKKHSDVEQEIEHKNAVIDKLNKDLVEEVLCNEKLQKEIESKAREMSEILSKENDELMKAIGMKQNLSAGQVRSRPKYEEQVERNLRDIHHQVHDSNNDITHVSMDSYKTISDLEKIIQNKNRTITSLQSDITYLKTIMAESENKLLDVSKDLDMSKENCQQLSSQLKKIVHQKNEEISELKKQVTKLISNENRVTHIIKVSAKYQAIILKRIAEIKSTSVLKELTNFGNSASCDNELRRSLNTGSITMEDLENFLETTEKHIRRCSEKQIALQKDKDRLLEMKRINESELISMKKFLTELSVCIKTFNSVKEMYTQKLSRVVSLQRTVRREILSLDGHITDATMCKLERGYAAVIQDLSECAMNLERWMERCIGRAISTEKIKQALINDVERPSLASSSFQNASLEVQLEELEVSFHKLLEEVIRAQKGEGAKDAQALTVMEVRAEYEDKLNRMKAKMKQLYTEQIALFKEKQKEEIATLESELQRARDKLQESSKVYEDHIRGLTTELWNVGEKFLVKNDEAEWLRKKQKSGSLMSLQHVHSSGLVARLEEPSRPSDAHSLRSLPVNNNTKETKEGRGLHMSDEEGEVFDNRWLRELAATPGRGAPGGGAAGPAGGAAGPSGGARLSELRWRNSLCPPHLKSSYPAETQFAPALQEDDIKSTMSLGGKQRKEVGITAYKKPGPPTPSKQAGRLSATDSELRESLRVDGEPSTRRAATPSRLRSLFRSNKHDNTEGTPRRRISNIFRKK